jgi:hypothetical protein
MNQVFKRILILELFAIAWAGASFTLISEKLWAGISAGTVFIALGILILTEGVRWKPLRYRPTFLMGLIHLFFISLPMLFARLWNYSMGFEQIEIWGLAGPVFHRLSTGVYFLLILATLFDWFRLREIQKQ